MFAQEATKSPEAPAQEETKKEEPEKEGPEQKFVEVVNVEVTVRAQKKGKPVKGLKATDFKLLEDGEVREITSFGEMSRTIGTDSISIAGDESAPTKRRLFLLLFWLSELSPECDSALDYFFQNVYSSGDYVLMVAGKEIFKITSKEDVGKVLVEARQRMAQIASAEQAMYRQVQNAAEEAFRNFEREFFKMESTQPLMRRNHDGSRRRGLVDQLVGQYRALWNNYNLRRNRLDSEKLIKLAESLKPLNFEKWGLVFYHHDTFPIFNKDGVYVSQRSSSQDLRTLETAFDRLKAEMNSRDSSADTIKRIRDAFIDANATFHTFLLKTKELGMSKSQFLKEDHIHTAWKETFTEITRATGGKVTDTNQLEQVLPQTLESEDIFYRMTYKPKPSEKMERTIRMEVKKRGVKLLYNPAIVLKKANEILIENVEFTFPQLKFNLRNYQQLFDGRQLSGDVRVKVTAVDEKGEMLTFNRKFDPTEEILTASFKVNFPHGGKYSLIVEAGDNQTGRKALYSQKVDVPKTGADLPVLITPELKKGKVKNRESKLESLLKIAAKYCHRLEKTTFYFTCKESIEDLYILKGEKVKDDKYLHNYQIIMESDGQMYEQRSLPGARTNLKKKKKKRRKKVGEDYFLLTNFFSKYPYLMPVSLLKKENQRRFDYQLLQQEKVGKVNAYKISVEPKNKKNAGAINHGIVWVSPKDGSILKIQLSPYAVRGIKTLQKIARKKGARIKVNDIHWYEAMRNGVRFPSRTEISEVSVPLTEAEAQAMPELEHLKTVFGYKDYRFFSVNTDVVDSGHH